MKLPIAWLLDYLPADLRGQAFVDALAQACRRWDLEPSNDSAQTLGKLLTFAGFGCDGIEGSGESAILTLDVLSNRPDGQCILGLAREVAAILKTQLLSPFSLEIDQKGGADRNVCPTISLDTRDSKKPPAVELHDKESVQPAAALARVSVEEPDLCPRYTARVIRGVKVGPSPQWLQDRLKWIGLQPRNNIVDVTNFICFELNQPLHAFDLNGLDGRQIIVRRARDKEMFTPLYGEIPALTPETLVIADATNARAVAGVLGGKGSEVTLETRDVLLEAAYFNPANTRRTVRRLKVMDGRGTDSSFRFERGIDIESVANASARAARMIVEVAGGVVAPGLIDVYSKQPQPKTIELRFSELNRVFGAPVPETTACEILESLCATGGLSTSAGHPTALTVGQVAHGTSVSVRVPSWRRGDLEREIDLIEEVARLYGYNKVPEITAMSARVPVRSALEITSDRLRSVLTALGYFEVVSDSLIDPKWPSPAVWTSEKPLQLDRSSVLREDHSALRNSLLASLLSVRRYNQDQRAGEARLFEIGKLFLPRKQMLQASSGKPKAEVLLPEERHVVSMLDDRGFQVLADTVMRFARALELDQAHLKLSTSIESIVGKGMGVTPITNNGLNNGHAAFLRQDQACRVIRVREMTGDERAEDVVGWMGLISPELQTAFDLRKPVAMCELDLQALAALPSAPQQYTALPAFPEIVRDVAMVVDEQVTWMEIQEFARGWEASGSTGLISNIATCETAGRWAVSHVATQLGRTTRDKLRDPVEMPRFLSVFRGKQVGSGKKSVAFSIVYRASDRTLTDDEVNVAHTQFQQAILAQFKATLRM